MMFGGENDLDLDTLGGPNAAEDWQAVKLFAGFLLVGFIAVTASIILGGS